MKYTYKPPTVSIPETQGIQTANKNIYSYFMKNDSSHYVAPEHRYAKYRQESDQTYILVVTSYTSSTADYRYKHNEQSIEVECLLGRSINLLQREKVDFSRLAEAIHRAERKVPDTEKTDPKRTFVALAFPDGLCRVSLMNIVDGVLNHSLFKGVLLLPISLAVSFGHGLSNALVVDADEASVQSIEDNCLVPEGHAAENRAYTKSMYGEDLVEDFLRKEEPVPRIKHEMECHLCNRVFDMSDFEMHFRNRHRIDVYKNLQEADALMLQCKVLEQKEESTPEPPKLSFYEKVANVLQRIQSADHLKKVCSTLVYITETRTYLEKQPKEGKELATKEKQEAEAVLQMLPPDSALLHLTREEKYIAAWKGLCSITLIEPSKELWLTDKEWKSVGLRILKEKVLFAI